MLFQYLGHFIDVFALGQEYRNRTAVDIAVQHFVHNVRDGHSVVHFIVASLHTACSAAVASCIALEYHGVLN
ncbi:hypothetical protein SDC9_191411 [bioreactor metagenome]|uniref:Uncharacterized protein n=1 Tax=bioreactor metagenome TaxID=1076179 RepID=A0A645HY98_9ZZZZ